MWYFLMSMDEKDGSAEGWARAGSSGDQVRSCNLKSHHAALHEQHWRRGGG